MYRYVEDAMDLLDSADADGASVIEAVETAAGEAADEIGTDVTVLEGGDGNGSTDVVTVRIPGSDRDAPRLGVLGRLGGVGARPEAIGMVSDADGAIVAVAAALRLAAMRRKGDVLPGEVRISTHVCPDAPTIPHDPVPFMDAPVSVHALNERQLDDDLDAVLSIDATKGNRRHCERGFAITPTVKRGWLLQPSPDLLDVQERVTGEPPSTLALSMADVTPYGNDVEHVNSIVQPATATDAPVVGVATTSTSAIPGPATGANYVPDLAAATAFVVEVAKDFTRGRAAFYDPDEYDRLVELYGSMERLQR